MSKLKRFAEVAELLDALADWELDPDSGAIVRTPGISDLHRRNPVRKPSRPRRR